MNTKPQTCLAVPLRARLPPFGARFPPDRARFAKGDATGGATGGLP